MYVGHGRLCVCLSLAVFPHHCTDPDVSWGNGKGCPLVVHYWADLQLVQRFRCYDNIAQNAKCQQVLVLCYRAGHYIFALWFFLFFSSPNLSRRRLDVCLTSTRGVALVRL